MNPTLAEEDFVSVNAGWAPVALHILKFHEDPVTGRALPFDLSHSIPLRPAGSGSEVFPFAFKQM